MAKFAKGKSGNPGGRPKVPADVKKMRELTRDEFARAANQFLFMTRAEIKVKLEAVDTVGIELMVGEMIDRGIRFGDPVRLGFVLDRLIGKVPTKIDDESLSLHAQLVSALAKRAESA